MDHSAALLETLAIGLVAAFIGGIVATKLRLPTIVGYLVAGVFVGPFTPGLVADTGTAQELAELGVILLMFGVGIHFSVGDLLAVRSTAIPGAIGQILVATLLGIGLGIALGWGFAGGLVLGLAVSVASTIVLLRALEARDEVDSPQGRIAVGWLIVEDLFTVLVLVLLPSLAPMLLGQGGDTGGVVVDLVVALAKLGAFAALMLVVGVRVVPRLLLWVKDTGSRELFTLSVLAVAIGIAVAAYAVFGVSFALGAFLAGVVLNESEISHQAAEDALPLRDAFAVLFFVSVGMLFDPAFLARAAGRHHPRHAAGRRGQEPRGVRDRRAPAAAAPRGAHRRCGAQPGRRVLVHPRHARAVARADPRGRVPARRGGGARVDHPQPVPVPADRPARGGDPVPARAAARPRWRGPARGAWARGGMTSAGEGSAEQANPYPDLAALTGR